MSTSRDDIMRKVKSLLAKAGDESVTEAEAGSFLAKAQEFMLEWCITELEVGNYQKSDYESVVLWRARQTPRFVWLWTGLLNRHFTVKCVEELGYRMKQLTMYGRRCNLEWAEYVYNFLIGKANTLWLSYKRANIGIIGEGDRGSYYCGLRDGLDAKLEEAKQRVPGTALVVINKELDDKFSEAFPHAFIQQKTCWSRSEEAEAAGFKEGRNLNLSRPVAGNSPKVALQ